MRKVKWLANRTEDKEKLEETVKAAEAMIALLKQFGVDVSSDWIRAVDKARKQLSGNRSAP